MSVNNLTKSTVADNQNYQLKQAIDSQFLVLFRPAPNSFVLVSKIYFCNNKQNKHTKYSNIDYNIKNNKSNLRPRFFVVIGPQVCSCQNEFKCSKKCQPELFQLPCIHILFVMLQVLRIPIDDEHLMQIPLPSFKVEQWIRNYLNFEHGTRRKSLHDAVKLLSLEDLSADNRLDKNEFMCKLAIPQPLRLGVETHQTINGNRNKLPSAFAIVGCTIEATKSLQESNELENVSHCQRKIKSACYSNVLMGNGRHGDSESATTTTKSVSRTSSADSKDEKLDLSKCANCSSGSRKPLLPDQRPQTAPQYEPTTATGCIKEKLLRHASSTLFRPIQNYSPILHQAHLTPIQSEENSANMTLNGEGTSTLTPIANVDRHHCCRPTASSDAKSASRTTSTPTMNGFIHARQSSFKPIKSTGPTTLPNCLVVARRSLHADAGVEVVAKSPDRWSNGDDNDDDADGDGDDNEQPMAMMSSRPNLAQTCGLCLRSCSCSIDSDCKQLEALLSCCTLRLANGQQSHCGAMFHASCCKIWLEELLVDGDWAQCPLCASLWTQAPILDSPLSADSYPVLTRPDKDQELDESTVEPHKTMTVNKWSDRESMLPVQVWVNPHVPDYDQWVTVFSIEIAANICSCDWVMRQKALQQATQIITDRVAQIPPSDADHYQFETIGTMFRLIQYLLDDSVNNLYIDSLRSFSQILGCLVCLDAQVQTTLQRSINPIIRRLLRFVGGPCNLWSLRNPSSVCNVHNHHQEQQVADQVRSEDVRTSKSMADLKERSNLALATLVELAKGQLGTMALAREVPFHSRSSLPISGLQHMTRFVLSSAKFHTAHLIGRLLLVEKLIKMNQSTLYANQIQYNHQGHLSVLPGLGSTDELSRRYVCSVIVFARRHLISGWVKGQRTNCFPNHYQTGNNAAAGGVDDVRLDNDQIHLKANRIAFRVFLAASRLLLASPIYNKNLPNRTPSTPGSSDQSGSFCGQKFVELQLKKLDDISLVNRLRYKLGILFYASPTKLVPDLPPRVPKAPTAPPTPPPRRGLSEVELVANVRTTDTCINHDDYFLPSSHVRIGLEPAYDLVAPSDADNYRSDVDNEDLDDDVDDDDDDVDGMICSTKQTEPIYTGRSLGSESDLQAEQVTVLRRALTQSTHPLLPIPALSLVMKALQSTANRRGLPKSDEYYESVDWICGPILGQGAFAQCYQARDSRTGLLMAVKRIRFCADDSRKTVAASAASSLIEQVESEIRIMLQLDHPNVLRFYGAVHCDRRAVVDLFVEWMPGGSVTSLLKQFGPFNESIALAYGVQILRGLAYLHKCGILHRDLKGANLLVDSTGSVVKISDFGASARLSGEQSVAGQFQGQVIGTFSFMAPEVLRGEAYGRACDIWSAGCCLIEMLTGKPPWHEAKLTNRYALMFTIATSDSPPQYPNNLSADLYSVLDSCFARNPLDRPTALKLLNYSAFVCLTKVVPSQRQATSNIDIDCLAGDSSKVAFQRTSAESSLVSQQVKSKSRHVFHRSFASDTSAVVKDATKKKSKKMFNSLHFAKKSALNRFGSMQTKDGSRPNGACANVSHMTQVA